MIHWSWNHRVDLMVKLWYLKKRKMEIQTWSRWGLAREGRGRRKGLFAQDGGFMQGMGTSPFYFILFCFIFFLFRAASVAYGSPSTRGRIRVVAAGLHHTHSNSGSETHATAHGNAESITHQARSGIEPVSSWISVGFLTTEPWWELHFYCILV